MCIRLNVEIQALDGQKRGFPLWGSHIKKIKINIKCNSMWLNNNLNTPLTWCHITGPRSLFRFVHYLNYIRIIHNCIFYNWDPNTGHTQTEILAFTSLVRSCIQMVPFEYQKLLVLVVSIGTNPTVFFSIVIITVDIYANLVILNLSQLMYVYCVKPFWLVFKLC